MLWLLFIVAILYIAALAVLLIGQNWPTGAISPPGPASSPDEDFIRISVIVAARNEAENLPQLLAGLQKQDFSGDYEVILVLDRCTDGSQALVQDYAAGTLRLRVLQIAETPPNWS
ncbi:MAG TPA: glycosyltransferase, partial [Bacteroidetes bacterium]|nr:glycosyltransferase [Bacteroidota bacterium]